MFTAPPPNLGCHLNDIVNVTLNKNQPSLAAGEKFVELLSDAPVLKEPKPSAKKIAEVHKGRYVHIIGSAPGYFQILMQTGVIGFIPIEAAEPPPSKGRTDQESQNGGQGGDGTACLGMTANYTSYSFSSIEEHGVEVLTIDRNGPAEEAGLKPAKSKAALTAAAAVLGVVPVLGPVSDRYLENAAIGDLGDLIVAVDDWRIRSLADFNEAIEKAHPGDTVHLTVIRPLASDDYETTRVAVKMGRLEPGTADFCAEATTGSSQPAPPY